MALKELKGVTEKTMDGTALIIHLAFVSRPDN